MGNCQAAEAATVVIQHPGNKIERIYWSVSAHHVMCSNPGHYVALVVTSPAARSENAPPARQLKLLRAEDALLIGQVYRLVSFEDVMKEFATKKSVKLGKLLKETAAAEQSKKKKKKKKSGSCGSDLYGTLLEEEDHEIILPTRSATIGGNNHYRGVGKHYGAGGQWRPALQTIAEVGS